MLGNPERACDSEMIVMSLDRSDIPGLRSLNSEEIY